VPESEPFRETQAAIRTAWAAAESAFAEPAWPALRPRIRLHATEATYDAARPDPGLSALSFLSTDATADVALKRRNDARFAGSVRGTTASLAIRTHFGGDVPFWVDQGLATWAEVAIECDGKPAKPKAYRVTHARNAVKAGGERALPAVIDAGWTLLDRADDGAHEAWAWHAWFRHGNATDADRALYARALAELRDHGDWRSSRAVWGETDATKMATRFRAWLARWK
jgi:hypothetical protein